MLPTDHGEGVVFLVNKSKQRERLTLGAGYGTGLVLRGAGQFPGKQHTEGVMVPGERPCTTLTDPSKEGQKPLLGLEKDLFF